MVSHPPITTIYFLFIYLLRKIEHECTRRYRIIWIQFDEINHFRCCLHPDIIPTEHKLLRQETRKNTKRTVRRIKCRCDRGKSVRSFTHIPQYTTATATSMTPRPLYSSHIQLLTRVPYTREWCATRQLKHIHAHGCSDRRKMETSMPSIRKTKETTKTKIKASQRWTGLRCRRRRCWCLRVDQCWCS